MNALSVAMLTTPTPATLTQNLFSEHYGRCLGM